MNISARYKYRLLNPSVKNSEMVCGLADRNLSSSCVSKITSHQNAFQEDLKVSSVFVGDDIRTFSSGN